MFRNFFSRGSQCVPYKMFSITHLVLIVFAFLIVVFLLHMTKNRSKENVKSIIKKATITMWCMETVKIVFNLVQGNAGNVNTYVPLYYCSLPLYCGFGAVYGKGKLKTFCDVFMLVGGVTGGIIYIIFPATTAGMYPGVHYITWQSFIHHSVMAYVGVLLIRTDYVQLKLRDIKYYATIIIIASVIAYGVNLIFDSNLMFVSKNFPGTAIEVVYNICPLLYPVMITLIQAVLPYFLVYGCVKIYNICRN